MPQPLRHGARELANVLTRPLVTPIVASNMAVNRATSSPSTGKRTIVGWACTFCSVTNGPDIHRCRKCHRLREAEAAYVEIETSQAEVSPAEAAYIDRITSASVPRAVWLQFRRPRTDPGQRKWRWALWTLYV